MRTFTFSDLNRRAGHVTEVARRQPVALTERGKVKIVMMPADLYDELSGREATRSAHWVDEAPSSDLANLIQGFREIAEEASASRPR